MRIDAALGSTALPNEPMEIGRLFELSRGISIEPVLFDAKGDQELIAGLAFLASGQKAYGEWLKRLSVNDRAPRGKCGRYFAVHSRFRRSI